ncbi:hypothetical protein KBA41_03400 [Candidatus Ozemobacteraceae bacterium]|nr:hypothetical protein [Candidatus Ozemobacteraceae bacterium]
MALRINTNVTALSAHRNLAVNDSGLSKSIERLSSGLRINRAADDAAGLTISEKLRTQVRGISRAIMNVQDGVSLIQTAEGALNEIQAMLQRMRELALQSSNDTLTSTDRLEIQKEVQELKKDINRISYNTEFNTRKLLDGTGTAVISTSDPDNLDAVVTDQVLTFSDFSVVVYPQTVNVPGQGQVTKSGTAQQQRSNIFMRTDGQIASGSTTLQSISNFSDNDGYFILDTPQTLYVQGDNHLNSFVISKDLTLDQLAERMQAAITKDQLGNGLNFTGSTVVFSGEGETQGQLLATSGKKGLIGRINFTGEQNLISALGFGEVVAPEDPVYSIAVTNLGLPIGERTSNTTKIADSRAVGLIQGIDLVFTPPTQAYVTSQAAVPAIKITSGFTFQIQDSTDMGAANIVSVSITTGTFSMEQIASIVDTSLSTSTAATTVRVRLNDASALEFYTTDTGSSAYINIANAPTGNALGIADGRYSGTGGTGASATGSNPPLLDFTSTASGGIGSVAFTITDFHTTAVYTVKLTANFTGGGLSSLVQSINSQLAGTMIRAEADNGLLRLKSLETGFNSNFTIGAVTGDIATSLYIDYQTTSNGVNGIGAVQDFAFTESAVTYGFNIPESTATATADPLRFYIADLDGNGMTISVAAATAGASFLSIGDLANMINAQANVDGVQVAAEVETATQTIRLFSAIPGKNGEVTLSDLGGMAGSVNTLQSVLGITPQTYANGIGDYSYKVHVKDTSISFQIGANQGETEKAHICRTDVVALGIMDLDLTTIRSSENAITLVDQALQKISSERSRLGAIENRMSYTTNSLRVALENMSAADSQIRDLDMAGEVINLTKYQILQQASNSMLAQANVSSQRVLDLLR